MEEKKQPKSIRAYTQEVNKMVRAAYGDTIPPHLFTMIRKTAQDMQMLERIQIELEDGDMTSFEIGSMGQQKCVVNPLVPYYDKISSRVTDDLYNLGLTSRKAALKSDPTDPNDDNPMQQLAEALR
jgi:hypothetical protein